MFEFLHVYNIKSKILDEFTCTFLHQVTQVLNRSDREKD